MVLSLSVIVPANPDVRMSPCVQIKLRNLDCKKLMEKNPVFCREIPCSQKDLKSPCALSDGRQTCKATSSRPHSGRPAYFAWSRQ